MVAYDFRNRFTVGREWMSSRSIQRIDFINCGVHHFGLLLNRWSIKTNIPSLACMDCPVAMKSNSRRPGTPSVGPLPLVRGNAIAVQGVEPCWSWPLPMLCLHMRRTSNLPHYESRQYQRGERGVERGSDHLATDSRSTATMHRVGEEMYTVEDRW